jgi:multidrug resistance efflux pump
MNFGSSMYRECKSAGLTIGAMLLVTQLAVAQDVIRVDADDATLKVLREVQISSEVAGKLQLVTPAVEGVEVKKGDLLLQLNDAQIRAEVTRIETEATQTTEIDFAQKSLELANATWDQRKSANLKKAGVFTPQEMRITEMEVQKAEAQLRKAHDDKILRELDVEVKKALLAQYTAYAPFDGQITAIHRFPGQNVGPNDAILTLTDMSVIESVVQVNLRDRDLLYVGDQVEFRIDFSATPSGQAATGSKVDATDPKTPTSGESDSSSGSIFDRARRPGGPQFGTADDFNPDVAARPDTQSGLFIGTIMFIERQINRIGTQSYVQLSVHIPNPRDEYGRYSLQEGIPVKAVVLAKKR